MKTKYLLVLPLILLILSCKQEKNKTEAALLTQSTQKTEAAIELTMEGKTYTMQQNDLAPIHLNIPKDSLLYNLYTNDSPISINFNLTNTDILQEGSKTYQIPEANSGSVLVDLSLFDKYRDVSRMNKRIIFRKGKIDIKKITAHSLHMTFEGEGSGMMERSKSFPITGLINITY